MKTVQVKRNPQGKMSGEDGVYSGRHLPFRTQTDITFDGRSSSEFFLSDTNIFFFHPPNKDTLLSESSCQYTSLTHPTARDVAQRNDRSNC